MRRIAALLGKELRQHAVAGTALLAFLGGAYLLMLVGTAFNPETVTLMVTHVAFLTFVVLGALVLGNRLVVAEYYGRTQLFVEALPVRRWEMIAVKYLLGLGVLFLAAGGSLLLTTLAALTREPIDSRFVFIVGARTAVYVFFIWSFFFAMGLIGRYRIPIYIAIFLALTILDSATAFEIEKFGPIAVIDNSTFPFEREALPTRAVLVTLALGFGWTVLAFLLAQIYEGSVAEVLARRMSQKEKALIGILFTALVLAFGYLEERREKEPYTFPEEEVLASEKVPLEILYLVPARRDDAAALLGQLETDLSTLAAAIDWQGLPGIRVAYSPALDAGIYDRAEIAENDGILVRANFQRTEDWEPQAFRAYLLGLVLDEATRNRARFEPKAWLRDGFARWWTARADSALATDPAESCRERTTLRALWVTRHEELDPARLAAWLRYRERHGRAMAEAVALSGLLVLERQHGRDAVLGLGRRVFGRRPPEDLRELFYEQRRPMAAVFEQTTSLGWPDFIARWNAELERLRAAPPCRAALAAIPEGTATVEIEHVEGTVRDVVYRFHFDDPVVAGTLATLLHFRLTPFDSELARQDLGRVENLWPEDAGEAQWRLPGHYGEGSRVFLALELHSAVLGGPLRLHAERRRIP